MGRSINARLQFNPLSPNHQLFAEEEGFTYTLKTGMTCVMKSMTVKYIFILNLVVFIMWKAFNPYFMMAHFAVSWNALEATRYWTVLTSVFSHYLLWHFLLNMMVLMSFGGLLDRLLGRRRFLIFYLLAGSFASLCHALVGNYVLSSPNQSAVGASGALAGVILLFALMFPKERIYIFGILPIPALVGALAFVGLDVYGLLAQSQGGGLPIGHGAHLGGALFGMLYYFLFKPARRGFFYR